MERVSDKRAEKEERRMTLIEAIKHCEEKAKELKTKAEERPYRTNSFSLFIPMSDTEVADCLECAKEHEQLAKWLKELKSYKDAEALQAKISKY